MDRLRNQFAFLGSAKGRRRAMAWIGFGLATLLLTFFVDQRFAILLIVGAAWFAVALDRER